jgi:hypothetical protein
MMTSETKQVVNLHPFPLSTEHAAKHPWEQTQLHLALVMVGCMFLHFLVGEASTIATKPDCAVTACFNICRTIVLGAAGFIAAGALRAESIPSTNDETSNDDTSHDTAALAMAAEAYNASPTAMAVIDTHRHIEKCNPAFVHLVSRVRRHNSLSPNAAIGVATVYESKTLDNVLGIFNHDDVQRLQQCFANAGAVSSTADMACHQGGCSEYTDCEFVVHDRILRVHVVSFMAMDKSCVGAKSECREMPPFGMHTLSSKGKEARCRFIVVVSDVTLDRAIERAIDSKLLQCHRQNEALMRYMRNKLASTSEDAKCET